MRFHLSRQIPPSLMSMCELSFYAKISDPMISSTYMTTLSTISNLGHSWIKTLFLYLMDMLTWKSCISSDEEGVDVSCVTIFDGYYVEIVFGVIFAMFWYFIVRTSVEELQNLPETSWHVTTHTTTTKADGRVNGDAPKVLNIV
jgi:MFS transporter, PAT family, solute carrier family 33 (acetyl-CoA transportor), member 1